MPARDLDATPAQQDSQQTDALCAIGRAFRRCPRTAVAVAAFTVGIDFLIVTQRVAESTRVCFALVMFAAVVYLTDGDLNSIGLRVSPRRGWIPWVSTSLKIAVAVGGCLALGIGICAAVGHLPDITVIHPTRAVTRFAHMCFVAPVMEETIYRLIACGLIAAIAGHRKTIAISGLLFALLHVLYGNPSPENLVGGFFLAWVYLKSETILLSIILHSVGNSLAFSAQLVAFYAMIANGT